MDIETAYLYTDIDEVVYMKQPEGFEKLDNKGKPLVCKLNKFLYGLKQSSSNWYMTLKKYLEDVGFVSCINDECLFVRKGGEFVGYCCIWV